MAERVPVAESRVCASCGVTFAVTSREAPETQTCPTCGAQAPADHPANRVGADGAGVPPRPRVPTPAHAELEIPIFIEDEADGRHDGDDEDDEATDPSLSRAGTDQDADWAERDAGAADEPAAPVEMFWRLRCQNGLRYSFHDIRALRKWSQNHLKDRRLLVSNDEIVWKLYWDFDRLLAEGGEPQRAFEQARSLADADMGGGASLPTGATAAAPSLSAPSAVRTSVPSGPRTSIPPAAQTETTAAVPPSEPAPAAPQERPTPPPRPEVSGPPAMGRGAPRRAASGPPTHEGWAEPEDAEGGGPDERVIYFALGFLLGVGVFVLMRLAGML